MKPAELLLHYQEKVDRARSLVETIEQVQARLATDPIVVELEEVLVARRTVQSEVAARLRASDLDREDHRAKLRAREKELMSGRIRNPSDLMQMSQEVQHMKDRFATEEAAELELMEEAETADDAVKSAVAELESAQRQSAAEEPELREQLKAATGELAEVEAERDALWADVPVAHQNAYNRMRMRPAIARVSGTQCAACHVTVTSSGMQILRKGDEPVFCENCGRMLVVAN